ncbi:MAG TPA: radical SAM/SPASM domain-containing protein [Thermodesulfobacteriota bacterium]|nr:radical SAM/SPASM domain-containing protein [Thermodesulfobacteriota bacterium]
MKNPVSRALYFAYSYVYFLAVFIRNKKRTAVVDYPFRIFNIELTNKCPMKCIMCSRTYGMTREQGFMDFQVFKKAIDELMQYNRDYASGKKDLWLHHFGESLLHPEFDKFIAYASGKGISVCLSVNPIMLTAERTSRLIGSKPRLLYLSLDGHDDESFFKIRGMRNAYERSKENILNFLELKNRCGSGMETILSMINFRANEEAIRKVKRFWEKQPYLDGFLIKKFANWDGSVAEVNALDTGDSPYTYRAKILNRLTTCNIPWETLTIAWDGDVIPCCLDYNKKYVLGNIKDSSLSDIWNNERMVGLRNQFISNEVGNPLCVVCRELRGPHPLWSTRISLVVVKWLMFLKSRFFRT